MQAEQVATFDLLAVRRFADLAVDALSAAREEIDALNVYPVPDGDTGTNMFLTVESARDAMVAALARAPRRPTGGDAGLRPRRAARGPGQLRGDPEPARRRAAAAHRSLRSRRPLRRGVRRGHGAGHRRGVLRGRQAGRGHHPLGRPGRVGRGARGRGGRLAAARGVVHAATPGRPRGARPHPRAAARAGVRRGGRRRRSGALRGPRRRGVRDHRQARRRGQPPRRLARDPGRQGALGRPDRGRPGVRGDVPPGDRRRRHPRAPRGAGRAR